MIARTPISIRLKILVIVLGFFSLIAAAFAVYSAATTKNYKRLRMEEVTMTVAFESERVGRAIAEMERNAVDLSHSGYHFYRSRDRSPSLGQSIAVENFNAFRGAAGGGIWFEPFVITPGERRVCYYALFDECLGEARYDPEFGSEAYDYHTKGWYTEIAAGLRGKSHTVWSAPYYDNIGTQSLMTTVGAGIFDVDGSFIGMASVDWEIQSVVDRLSAIRPTANSFVLLAYPRNDYVISNTGAGGIEQAGRSLRGLPWVGALDIAEGDTVRTSAFRDRGIDYIAFSRVFGNGWLFSVQIPAREIFEEIETRNNHFSVIIAVAGFFLLMSAFYLLSLLINQPLSRLTSGVAELGGGNLDRRIEIDTRDEIGTLAAAFNRMTVSLKASIEQNARVRAEKERIGAELDVARDIQASMLPCVFPPFPDRREFDIYATMIPAREVGGDFYDFLLVDKNTLAVVIADVSGKGIPAALFMVVAKTLIKNNVQAGDSPGEVFRTVNGMMCESNDAHMFVTAFMGYLDIPSGKFTFVNAGHNPPLVKRAGGRYERLPVKPGFVLAVIEGMAYTHGEIELSPGDTLYLYTDGVTEALNKDNKMFGDNRLSDKLSKLPDRELREFTMAIKGEIDRFADGAEQADDITMLVLRYNGVGDF